MTIAEGERMLRIGRTNRELQAAVALQRLRFEFST